MDGWMDGWMDRAQGGDSKHDSHDPTTVVSTVRKNINKRAVRVFTGSDLITGSDRIGPEIGYLAHF